MINKVMFPVLILLAIVVSGCVAPLASDPAFQPKLEETGGPKILYSLRSDQVAGLFPMGTTLDQTTQKYGPPAMRGTATDKNGQPTTWIGYTYGRSYTHCDTSLHVTVVNRFTTVMLNFDASGKLFEASMTRYQKFSAGNGANRDATEDEVTRYLGAPDVLDIKAGATSAGGGKGAPDQSRGWKLGADVSELRSELVAKTGYSGRGVYVVAVEPQGLAARYGLAAGDIIVKVNNVAVPTRDDLVEQLKTIPLSNALELQVFAKGRARTVTIPAQQGGGGTSSI